jgi:hypothetical protein
VLPAAGPGRRRGVGMPRLLSALHPRGASQYVTGPLVRPCLATAGRNRGAQSAAVSAIDRMDPEIGSLPVLIAHHRGRPWW